MIQIVEKIACVSVCLFLTLSSSLSTSLFISVFVYLSSLSRSLVFLFVVDEALLMNLTLTYLHQFIFPGFQSCPSYRSEDPRDDLPLRDEELCGGEDHPGGQEEDDVDPLGGSARSRVQISDDDQTGA